MAKPTFVWNGSAWEQIASAGVDFSAYQLSSVQMRTVTGDDDLLISDVGRLLKADVSAPSTLTIPANTTVDFPTGATIRLVQVNSGDVTIAGDLGVTIVSFSGTKTSGQWAEVTITQLALDTWLLSGNLTTV